MLQSRLPQVNSRRSCPPTRSPGAGLEPGLYAGYHDPGDPSVSGFSASSRGRQPDAHADRPAGIRRTIKTANRPGCTVFSLFVQKIEDRRARPPAPRGAPSLVLARSSSAARASRSAILSRSSCACASSSFAESVCGSFFLRHGRKGIRSVIASSSFLCFDHGLAVRMPSSAAGGDAPA